jgi:signal transduction histidine kinase/CheY-like chemotaxis protein
VATDAPTLEDRVRLLEASVRGIVLELDQDGRYLDVWTHDESLLARPRRELLGKTLNEVFGEEGARPFFNMVKDVLTKGLPQRLEYPLEVLSGPRWFVAEALPGQRPGTAVMLIQDITERKQLEARIIESDRLAAIGLLAGGVGHEINNPLSWVLMQLASLKSEISGAAESGKAPPLERWAATVSESLEGVERIRHIVRDLAFFTRSPETESAVVDLRRAIDWACDMAGSEVRHRAALVKNYGTAPSVLAPEARIGQVFLNLVINAAQSIADGNADANEVRVELSTDDAGNARIDVVDTGSGIEPANQARLFEPFFTTKPRGVGTGLGLSVSKRLVESIGGTLRLVSSNKGSTRFRVTLPPTSTPPTPLPAPSPARVPQRLKVLIVDDQPRFLESLRLALQPPLIVITEPSARAALARLRNGERFDALVCDLMMPELTGMDLAEAVAQEWPAMAPRLVLMTGGAFSERARSFLEASPYPRIEKPFKPEQLIALLARVCQ